jgi:hypothetical protein
MNALEVLEQPAIAIIQAANNRRRKQKALALAKAFSKIRRFAVIVWS